MRKRVELFIDDIEEDGVFAISLVKDPAMEASFVLLDDEDKQIYELAKIDKEKDTITGVAMIPDKDIPRKNGEDIYFSKETVKLLSEDYLKNYYQFNTKVNHENEVQDVYMTETWIVENPELDKSKALGLENVKEGSWIVSLKVENKEILEQIKNDEYSGFSIEGHFAKKYASLKKEKEEMRKTRVKELFEKALHMFDGEEKPVEVIEDKKNAVQEEKPIEQPKAEEKPVEEKPVEEPKAEEKPVEEQKAEEKPVEEPKQDDALKSIMAKLDELAEENKELKKKIDEKPIPQPKFTQPKDDVPQTFHSHMTKMLNEKRKRMGLQGY